MINLATGEETFVGDVLSPLGQSRSDIEGLAFDRNNTLWALDDETQLLFPVNTDNALVPAEGEASLSGIGVSQGNDFGMTFTCTGELFITSVENTSLYTLGLDGVATFKSDLGVRISSLAAYGDPVQLYGLGNGLVSEGGPQDNRSLYRIDPETGAVLQVGSIGPAAADYFEAGLSFHEDGTLWAITDRRTIDQNLGSQVLSLDLGDAFGTATLVSTTTVSGFESLAIGPPAGCDLNQADDALPQIPVLDGYGLLLAFLVLLATGMAALHRRS